MIESIAGVADVHVIRGEGCPPDRVPELLIEVPHGATRQADFDRLRGQLVGSYPEDLQDFFFVNTDVGAFECAMRIADWVAEPARRQGMEEEGFELEGLGAEPRAVMVLRCLIPRTFIDCNRVIGERRDSRVRDGITPGLPEYVDDPADVDRLASLYDRYQQLAVEAYDEVCAVGGGGLILHTYAPRSVRIERVGPDIVEALRAAYEPAAYEGWDRRPDVDLISESGDGARMAPEEAVKALRRCYRAIGVEVQENATYRLLPSTMGFVHSARYPGRVVCLELNRERLADPFSPFEEMRIGESKVRRMAAPIAAAWLEG